MSKLISKIGFLRALTGAAIAGVLSLPAAALADPVQILFVGNSFTHGKYAPLRNYMSGYDSDTSAHVHDLLCPNATTCPAGTGQGVVPSQANPSIASLAGSSNVTKQLKYLEGHSSQQLTEPGPYGGIPGIFLKMTEEAGLNYNVSLMAVSSATLYGNSYLGNAANLKLIGSSKWDHVVLQDQSFLPLPSTVTVNGQQRATRGVPSNFIKGVNGLTNAIDAADKAAGKVAAPVTLYETQALANYGYTSNNPDSPIFGSSTSGGSGDPSGQPGDKYSPYVGAANPNAQMTKDLHNAYFGAASAWNSGTGPAAGVPASTLNVAPAGDAWITAMNDGLAVQDPYLTTNPANQIDLWDSNPLDACCTTPTGYHPGTYGAYLSALVLFGKITGDDPINLGANEQAAKDLGISPTIAVQLQYTAQLTLEANNATVPEPSSLALLATAFFGIAGASRFRVSRN